MCETRRICNPPQQCAHWQKALSHTLNQAAFIEGGEAALRQAKCLSTWRDLHPSLYAVPAEVKKPSTAHSRLTLRRLPNNKPPGSQEDQESRKKINKKLQRRKQDTSSSKENMSFITSNNACEENLVPSNYSLGKQRTYSQEDPNLENLSLTGWCPNRT